MGSTEIDAAQADQPVSKGGSGPLATIRSPAKDREQAPVVDPREWIADPKMKGSTRTAVNLGLFAFACLFVLATAFMLGYVTRAAHAPVTDEVPVFGVFWEAWELVDDHFIGDSSDETARTYGAIQGSLRALDDPYTVFIEPRERDREEEQLRGSFGGIGAYVERIEDGRVVLTPMPDRPAAAAGILAGDELVAVDGVPITPDMPFDDVLAMVRGEVGEVVRLTVRREGSAGLLIFEIERGEIVTPSVSWELLPDGVGYIKLSIFGERTNGELEDAIRGLRGQGAARYVVDLRDNGGGLLPAAVDVASQFLSDGVVLYERNSSGEERPFPVKDLGTVLDEPLVVLVNAGTASASEIVAGALQDYHRGKLVGTRTFGKASVQLVFELSDGSSLHVTNARWLTPSRYEIEGAGLTPDLEVEFTDVDRQENRDPQLETAIAVLLQEEAEMSASSNRKIQQ
jgi:carboxyl-terminal processing protease